MNSLARIAVHGVRYSVLCGGFALTLFASASARAGDVKAVEMLLRRADIAIETSQFDQAADRLAEAEKELSGITGDAVATLKERITAAREKSKAEEIRFHVEPLTKALQRQIDAATYEFEEGTRGDGNAEVAAAMERPLASVEEQLEGDEAKKWLPDAVRAEFKQRIGELRARGEKAGFDVRVRRAESWIAKVESVNAGTQEEQVYRDGVARWMDLAAEELAKLPPSDARKAQLSSRLEASRRGFDAMTASDDRDAAVNAVVARWQEIRGSDDATSESAPTYERWLMQSTLDMPKSESRCRRVQQMLEDDAFLRLKQEHGSDSRVGALAAEIAAEQDSAASKICATANSLLDRAESDATSNRKDLATALDRLREVVERCGRGAKDYDVTKLRAERAVTTLAAAEAAKAAAHAEMEQKCSAAAESTWPSIVESCGDTESIDPVAAVEDIASWKGRVVRVQGTRNRARWDFHAGDYDFVVAVNGVPVAGQIAPELREAIARAEAATGLGFDSGLIDDVVGVVVSACRVQGIEYSQLLKEHIPTVNYKAPLLRITALKAGPFALSIDRSASDGVEGLASVATPSESGGSWLRWLAILALAGGYVWRRREVDAWLLPRATALLAVAMRRLTRAESR